MYSVHIKLKLPTTGFFFLEQGTAESSEEKSDSKAFLLEQSINHLHVQLMLDMGAGLLGVKTRDRNVSLENKT